MNSSYYQSEILRQAASAPRLGEVFLQFQRQYSMQESGVTKINKTNKERCPTAAKPGRDSSQREPASVTGARRDPPAAHPPTQRATSSAGGPHKAQRWLSGRESQSRPLHSLCWVLPQEAVTSSPVRNGKTGNGKTLWLFLNEGNWNPVWWLLEAFWCQSFIFIFLMISI